MFTYLLAGLVVLAFTLGCAKDSIIEVIKHPSDDTFTYAIAIAGIYVLWPLFVVYVIFLKCKGR